MEPQVEYVGFKTEGAWREYTLRVRRKDDESVFTVLIPIEAFLAKSLRFQDGPEVCFLKLQNELRACAEGLPNGRLTVTTLDLEDYRAAHTPKPARRLSKTLFAKP